MQRVSIAVLRHLSRSLVMSATLVVGATAHAQDRSIDGVGNNPTHPEWGAPGQNLLRGPSGAHYADGVSALAGADRPSPRAVSNALFKQTGSIPNREGISDFIWTWGQFLDHDLSLTEGANERTPVSVPLCDEYLDPLCTGTQVIPFKRSVYDPSTGTSPTNPRQQFNEITGYLDGSNVYGSDAARAAWLRTLQGGKLKVTHTSAGDLLPYNDGTQPNAGSPEQPDLSTNLFLAGDIRANEQPTLAVMHTLFVREHNWQADRIAKENPSFSDEQIYQAARRIVIAELQHITYEEFLKALLGAGALKSDHGYDPHANAGIAQNFSTAAYRLGHTLLSPFILRLNEDGSPVAAGPLSLRDAFFNATPPLLENGGIEPFLRGAAAQKAQDLDRFIIDDVRSFLFGPAGAGGLDLIALNLQRGRDHGLPDFNTVRAELGLKKYERFSQITSDPQAAQALEQLYGNINNIDLFAGLFVEQDVPGGIVGETLRAALVDQFQRTRAGDRFWYERTLAGAELARVRSTRLSDIIRRNTGIQNIQNDVFFVPQRGK
jgi:peroxidase